MPEFPRVIAERRFGAGGPTLAEVGEEILLDRLVAISQAAATVGNISQDGDDAAVLSPPSGRDLAVSVDAVVEDVDFRRTWMGPRAVGRRAFGVAVADLAGMGAEPAYCLATLCARGTEQLDDVLDIQRGLCEAAAAAGCALVGGDVSAIEGPLVVDVCVTGSLPAGRALRRSSGRAGDVLLVTGVLGRAAAGLRLLLDGAAPATAEEKGWVEAQLQPAARLQEGLCLLGNGVRCGGDISDGLLLDAARTARASGCAVELWAASLPVDSGLRASFGSEWLQLAVGGGEDFELVAALPQADLPALLHEWPAELAALTVVGQLSEGSGVRLLDRRGGLEMPQPRSAARHFS
jgi:thiamine-monophosphate kinase